MNFKQSEALEILERTPAVLTHLLSGLSHEWLSSMKAVIRGILSKLSLT